mgnify:CR=1 FL=1
MKTLFAILCCAFLLMASPVYAQTVLRVSLATGQFAWDNPPGTTATQNVITCGAVSVAVPMPANTIAVNAVVPGPGDYTCVLYAQNSFDKSPGPDPQFPPFTAGYVPPVPTALRLEVR